MNNIGQKGKKVIEDFDKPLNFVICLQLAYIRFVKLSVYRNPLNMRAAVECMVNIIEE